MKNEFQANMAYRMNVIIRMFSYIIAVFIQISIWHALFNGAHETSTQMGTIDINEMVTYVVISTAISLFIRNEVILQMETKIKSGEIAMDLIKPTNLKLMIFSNSLGGSAFKLIFQFIPLIIVGYLFLNLTIPTPENVVLFIITLINAVIIYFLLTYIVGLLAFWYMAIWHLERFLGDLISLFAGAIVPLWFFPKVLLDISAVLPFHLIYFTPISIYLGKITVSDSIYLILQQFIWITVLILLEKVVWKNAVNKLVVQGG